MYHLMLLEYDMNVEFCRTGEAPWHCSECRQFSCRESNRASPEHKSMLCTVGERWRV